jgi:hypothetical protein
MVQRIIPRRVMARAQAGCGGQGGLRHPNGKGIRCDGIPFPQTLCSEALGPTARELETPVGCKNSDAEAKVSDLRRDRIFCTPRD